VFIDRVPPKKKKWGPRIAAGFIALFSLGALLGGTASMH